MYINKIVINGQLQDNAEVQNEFEDLIIEKSIVVSGSMRGLSVAHTVELNKEKIIQLQFTDGTEWLCPPDTLEEFYPGSYLQTREGSGSFELPATLGMHDSQRGIIGDVALKIVNIFTRKLAEESVAALAAKLEEKQKAGFNGLVSINARFQLEPLKKTDPSKPILLFIHGTNSSTEGSFGEIFGTPLWAYLTQAYGNNILGYQHATLMQSPLSNALDLMQQLPPNARLHIITHSRGGLVGEIISRFDGDMPGSIGFSDKEIAYLQKENRTDDVEKVKALNDTFKIKNFKVEKFIRVACPTNGTTILSKRLDHFFNISLNLIGLVTGAAANPVYSAMKQLLIAVIDQKNEVDVLPGVEAMRPDSPFINMLNNQSSDMSIKTDVVAIAGNCKARLNPKGIVILAGRLFYLKDNDLVVDTASMYDGSKRKDRLQYLLDEGDTVDHFHYFKNEKTNKAILRALQADTSAHISDFKYHTRGMVGAAERNAVLKLDGGEVLSQHISGKKPVLIIIPGIMGSNLTQKGDLVWINYLSFLSGGLSRISSDKTDVAATSLIKTSYGDLAKYFSDAYDVLLFPFDWRMPLKETTKKFSEKISELIKLEVPIKIIGHSMGGVLVRDFMVFHPEKWNTLKNVPGFQMVFLGSPLGGSYRILNVLLGEDDMIKKLAKIDLIHTKKELLRIFSQLQGIHSLLPLTDTPGNDFGLHETWQKIADAFGDNNWPVPTKALLDQFTAYRKQVLETVNQPEFDYGNAVYIAGRDKDTPCGYRIDDTIRGKELVLLSTGEGDQSCTWDMSIPQKISQKDNVYFVDVSHGPLSSKPVMFAGLKEILSKGSTALFPKKRPSVRATERVFRKTDTYDFDLSPDGVEKTILGISDDDLLFGPQQTTLKVSVSNGDLRYATYPVLAGHFYNDGIISAEKSIDWNLNGELSRRHKLGLYPGSIGSSKIFLRKDNSKFKGALIAGLGRQGELTSYQVMRTIEQGISNYLSEYNTAIDSKDKKAEGTAIGISPLVIGSGYGGLTIESSIVAILQAIQSANSKISRIYGETAKLVEVVEFIELYKDRALSCVHAIKSIEKSDTLGLNIQWINYSIKKLPGLRERLPVDNTSEWWTRINVRNAGSDDGDHKARQGLRVSISTDAAREEVRFLGSNNETVVQLLEEMSTDNKWSPELAKTIFELLIPTDFKSQVKRQNNINWILDEEAAAYPWELLQDGLENTKPLCVNAGMIRQLATTDYRININSVIENNALVIADPDLKGYCTQLPGARAEGEQVAERFKTHSYQVTQSINGSAAEILIAMFSKSYKIVHLAGHGVFNTDASKPSGMLIGNNAFLTTFEVSQMSEVPELVFVNCCFLGKTDTIAEEFYKSRYKLAANIGTQLIQIGVKAVIVSGWAVDDEAALAFSEEFYNKMFLNYQFGQAVKAAREKVYNLYKTRTNTWGAYQCYGDPFYTLDTASAAKTQKFSFVIPEEAEIELTNLFSKIDTGSYETDSTIQLLKQIEMEVNRADIRNSKITELEAMLYSALGDYEAAVQKFQYLMQQEDASFSLAATEKYCNARAKLYLRQWLGQNKSNGKTSDSAKKDSALKDYIKAMEKVIADLMVLQQFGATAERLSILGSTYKRLSQFKTGEEKWADLMAAAHFYRAAYYTRSARYHNYSLTNWLTLERVLILAGKRKWGEDLQKNGTKKSDYCYKLPSKAEALNMLEEAYQKNTTDDMDYWQMNDKSNMELCYLLLGKSGYGYEKVSESIKSTWSYIGHQGNKLSDLEHLDFLAEALRPIASQPGVKPIVSSLSKLQKMFATG